MEDSAAAGATVRDVNAHEFIRAYAAHLKNKIEQPKWADLVKTATWKELAPYDPDWYYVRAASIARKIYLRRGTGIGALRKVYGGRARNGAKPNHYRQATGSIIRHVLHQLEAIKVVEVDSKGGRQVTRDGRRDLDTIAVTCVARQE